mmetsp:Transcript_71723/g.203527  ORF Transcript_71723/g.203527 Transcript_71723/m.203527 type:complete len:369 (+) Transcript_71723:142-1248(+)
MPRAGAPTSPGTARARCRCPARRRRRTAAMVRPCSCSTGSSRLLTLTRSRSSRSASSTNSSSTTPSSRKVCATSSGWARTRGHTWVSPRWPSMPTPSNWWTPGSRSSLWSRWSEWPRRTRRPSPPAGPRASSATPARFSPRARSWTPSCSAARAPGTWPTSTSRTRPSTAWSRCCPSPPASWMRRPRRSTWAASRTAPTATRCGRCWRRCSPARWSTAPRTCPWMCSACSGACPAGRSCRRSGARAAPWPRGTGLRSTAPPSPAGLRRPWRRSWLTTAWPLLQLVPWTTLTARCWASACCPSPSGTPWTWPAALRRARTRASGSVAGAWSSTPRRSPRSRCLRRSMALTTAPFCTFLTTRAHHLASGC